MWNAAAIVTREVPSDVSNQSELFWSVSARRSLDPSAAPVRAAMSCARSSVPVVRLHGGRGHIELFDMLCPDMDDLVDILKCPLNQQELSTGDQRSILLVEIGVDDRIRDPGLVFKELSLGDSKRRKGEVTDGQFLNKAQC